MPPSGYSSTQTSEIVEFLQSLSISLKNEGVDLNLSPCDALEREIRNIDEIILSNQYSKIGTAVLYLTREFYVEVLNEKPTSYSDFPSIIEQILSKVNNDILAIHVPSISS